MRVLLFPGYVGGGFGHISRCLVLAEEMVKQKWEVAFVLGGAHADRLAAAGWTVFRPPTKPLLGRLYQRVEEALRRSRPSPSYLFFSDLSYQVVRDGFHTARNIDRAVRRELAIVDRFGPDVLIGDTWLLTSIVGRLANLPVAQIVRTGIHPSSPQLVWWRSLPSQLFPPEIVPIFNPTLEEWGLSPIERANDLLAGDLFLVPSIPQLDPLPAGIERTHYVGPLVRSPNPEDSMPDWLADLPGDRPVVYVTVGGGANAVRGLDLLSLWEAVFAPTDWEVVISTAGQPVPRRWQPRERFHVFPWVPGAAMVARSDALLFHGGYGTMMETVRAGVPSVVLPFHTEQESNGRRLQENGAARLLAPDNDNLQPVTCHWEGGEFTVLAAYDLLFQSQHVRDAVSAVLQEPAYRSSAQRLRMEQAVYGGAAAALEHIADLVIS